MRWWVAAVVALAAVNVGWAQSVGGDAGFGSVSTVGVFAMYANDSSHIYIGQEENRKLAGLGVGYSRRLARRRRFDFAYEAEVRPLTFVREPVVDGDTVVVVHGAPMGIVGLPGSGHFSGPVKSDCRSGTTSSDGVTTNGVSYTKTVTQQCGERWTYAGGISPLGLRFNFGARHRVQPFAVANAGFLVAGRDVPVNFSSNFNFTFEVGAGVEWFARQGRSWAVDYRVHHLSNAGSGFYNPGIDSGMFRVGYRFGR